ncbi:helix-turn-helix domain-containing protein [Streptomyces sp. NPDC086080]|uniref:helix-turn-helix domain-containing protein n=1 Tax=unclassified Streptomyces TaxID=2593676 RepID=UPI0033E36773
MSFTTTAAQPMDEPLGPPTSAGLRRIPKGQRITGKDAALFTAAVIKAYKTKSIRSICEETGRSYGAIHRLLTTNGVTMRSRGYQHTTSASSADTS